MQAVQVMIHQGLHSPEQFFDYLCPETISLSPRELIGRRVLVPFGGRQAEGIVLNIAEHPHPNAKMLYQVMDNETIVPETLLKLAGWMAEFYACPLSSCLRLMVPLLLHRPHRRSFFLHEKAQARFPEIQRQYAALPGAFWQAAAAGEMSEKEVRSWLTPSQIEELQQNQILVQGAEYYAGNLRLPHQVYVLADGTEPAMRLNPRAKKQRELLEWVKLRGEIPVKEIRERFSPAVIRGLVDKGILYSRMPGIREEMPRRCLTPEQQAVLERIEADGAWNGFREILLYGVTGSGKTEVYIQAIRSCLQHGRNAMLLVPEIALAQQAFHMLQNRIPNLVLFHSEKSAGERYAVWKQMKEGEAQVVLGARSALFAPLENLGLLIIDEEQESSYKNETMPCYHTVEVARQRMRTERGILLLGTATPTLESIRRALEGKTEMLSMKERISPTPKPTVYLESLRRQRNGLTPLLAEKIEERLKRGEQTLLFVNRRGYSPRVICMSCGEIQRCPHCSVALVYHAADQKNHCHYCNFVQEADTVCTACGSSSLQRGGLGTQKAEEWCRRLFPQARTARLDLDAAAKKNYREELLQRVKNGDVDILIGTQMIAKGLDFPNVSLVGVADADALFSLPDYRAAERAVQLLFQVAGRAGRAEKPGEIVLQTFQPENPLFQVVAQGDYMAFVRQELALRKQMGYPPYTHIGRILVRAKEEQKGWDTMQELRDILLEMLDEQEWKGELIGPAPCAVYRVQDWFRFQLFIKTEHRVWLASVIHHLRKWEKFFYRRNIRMEIDIDPIQA